jgi:stage V sporulation protein B
MNHNEPEDQPRPPVDLSTSKVISDTFFVSVSKIGVTLLKPIRGVILGRLLGPTLYGILNIPISYIQLLVLLSNFGFTTSVIKLVPEYLQKGRKDLAAMIYRAAIALTVAFSVLWCLLLIAFAPWIAENLAHEPDATLPIQVYALIIPFLAITAFYAVAFLAVQRGKLRAVITAVYGVLNVALPIAAVLWRGDIISVIAGFLTAEVIGALLFIIFFHRSAISHWVGERGSLPRGVREVFSFGILFFFANLGWNLISTVDRIMVKYYLPADQLGFYAMAAIVVTSLSVISSTAGTALIPSLTASRVDGSMDTFRRQIRSTARISLIALVPIVMLIFSLSGDALMIVLPKFIAAAGIMRILAFVGIVDIFCRISWAALASYAKGGMSAAAYIFAAAFNVALNAFLIPRIGVTGAAVATLATFFVLAVILLSMMWRISRAKISALSLLHPLVLSIVYPLLAAAFRSLSPGARIVIVLVAGSVAYMILAALTGLIRAADLDTAEKSLRPRAHVPHVRFALSGIALLRKLIRR